MELGLVYTPVMAIPPGEDAFLLTGYCTDKCTQLVSACPLHLASPWRREAANSFSQVPGSSDMALSSGLPIPSFKLPEPLIMRLRWKEKICRVQQTASSWLGCAESPSKQVSWGAICSGLPGNHSHKTYCRAGRAPAVLSLTVMGRLASAAKELAKNCLNDGFKMPTSLSGKF